MARKTESKGLERETVEIAVLATSQSSAASVFSVVDDLMAIEFRDELSPNGVKPSKKFRVSIVAAEDDLLTFNSGVTIKPHATVADNKCYDVVYCPVLALPQISWNPEPPFLKIGQAELDWVVAQKQAGAILAALCTGAYILAEAGLLDGVDATNIAYEEDRFQRLYPNVCLDVRRPLVIAGDSEDIITTSDGVYHSDLMLLLLERFLGREEMLVFAEMTGTFWVRDPSTISTRFLDRQNHQDAVIRDSQAWIEANLTEPEPVKAMVDSTLISERTFTRRFKKATGYTPLQYVQLLRVNRARKLLEGSRAPVVDVAVRVGYQDVAHFNRLFKRHTGVSPAKYRKRFKLAPTRVM
jgi:transcriptional regulator GlxA family with amidase domain